MDWYAGSLRQKVWVKAPAKRSEGNLRQARWSSPRTSLTDIIEVLTRYDWCFVSALGTVVGVISRIDMQKPAIRMWLFGIITVAELEFTERVRQKWPDESWTGLLSQQRLEKARRLHSERERRKENCDLLDCLQLGDKMEILISDPDELARLGIHSPSAAKRAGTQIESLRNSLAHAQGLNDDDWPQIVRLARRVEQLLHGFSRLAGKDLRCPDVVLEWIQTPEARSLCGVRRTRYQQQPNYR